jgi:hypothetical protein
MLRKGEESFGARPVMELQLLFIGSTLILCILQGLALRPPLQKAKICEYLTPPTKHYFGMFWGVCLCNNVFFNFYFYALIPFSHLTTK